MAPQAHQGARGGDLRSALTRIFLGLLGCVALETAFGLVLVRRHAQSLSAKMELFLQYGMTAVVQPDDPFLTRLWHQAGSALQFGLFLGVLTGLLAAAFALFQDQVKRSLGFACLRADILLVPVSLVFLFSADAPVLSLLCALLTPVAYRAPGLWIREKNPGKRPNPLRLALFALLLALAGSAVFGHSPYCIRDRLMDHPVGSKFVHFYYDHTPLAAHVVQPLRHLSQKAVAQCDGLPVPELLPSGSLWIVTPEPCLVKGASLVVCNKPLSCARFLSVSPELAGDSEALLDHASSRLDPNRAIRRGVRASITWGLPATGLLVVLWLGTLGEHLWLAGKSRRGLVLAATTLLAAFSIWSLSERELLKRDPSRVHTYAASAHAQRRYLALTYFPDRLSLLELERLAADPSPKVRHGAFVEMARRGDARFWAAAVKGLEDPEPLVRAKAALALAKAVPHRALSRIERILAGDPSWYVRDNAYRASWAIRPSQTVGGKPGS